MTLLVNKMALSALSALGFIGLLGMTAPSVEAEQSFSKDNTNKVVVNFAEQQQHKKYSVNGKVFYWQELSAEQQQRIALIESQFKKSEQAFKAQEKQLAALAKRMDKKAKEIQNEVGKMAAVSVKLDKQTVNMRDVVRIADQLAKLQVVNEKALKEKEAELEKLDRQMDKVNLSLVDDIESQARALEAVLVDIAESI